MTNITLAGQTYDIPPLPFGRLRKLIASFNQVRRAGMDSDEAMDSMPAIIGLLIDKPAAEVDAMPITMQEVIAVMAHIPALCGLTEVVSSGEALQVTGGMPSTPT